MLLFQRLVRYTPNGWYATHPTRVSEHFKLILLNKLLVSNHASSCWCASGQVVLSSAVQSKQSPSGTCRSEKHHGTTDSHTLQSGRSEWEWCGPASPKKRCWHTELLDVLGPTSVSASEVGCPKRPHDIFHCNRCFESARTLHTWLQMRPTTECTRRLEFRTCPGSMGPSIRPMLGLRTRWPGPHRRWQSLHPCPHSQTSS